MTRSGRKSTRREFTGRVVTLGAALCLLAVGLTAFYARQSLVLQFSMDQVTRTWIPVASLAVPTSRPTVADAAGIPVLVYHGIVAKGSSCNVTPETFRAHMLTLKRAGYRTLTMTEFAEYMSGKRKLPERSVLITFDDGRTDSFAGADPVLKRLGLHATMFSILGRAEGAKPFYLTLEETRMMSRTGRWDVQSHTANSHRFVPVSPLGGTGRALPSRLWRTAEGRLESDAEYVERVRGDLERAKRGLKRLTDKPVIALAYPWGDYGCESGDPVVRRELPKIAAAAYTHSFAQVGVTIDETYNYPADKGQVLRRIYVTHDMTARDLMARLERGKPKALPFADKASFASKGWATTSGALRRTGAGARSCVAGKTGRGEVFLDGSRDWRDYEVRTRLRLEESQTVSLIVRRAGPRDYLAVTLSGTYVSIEQVVSDECSTVAQADVGLQTDGATPHSIAVAVRDCEAFVQIDGIGVMRADGIDPVLRRGGVGVRFDVEPGANPTLESEYFSVAVWPAGSEGASEASDS